MRKSLGAITGIIGVALSSAVWAEGAGSHDAGQTAQTSAAPSYVPPMRGAPEARISGSTRGKTADLLQLDVLAPNHVGRTVQEQPTLYWYNSRSIAGSVEITIIADQTNKVLLDSTVAGPVPAGIHAFRLAGTAARLDMHVIYQWTVTDVVSKTEPSRNVVASGMVERVPASDVALSGSKSGADMAAAYARAGIWYDAIDALSRGIESAPANATLRGYRADLLAQIGLNDAANFDRGKKTQ